MVHILLKQSKINNGNYYLSDMKEHEQINLIKKWINPPPENPRLSRVLSFERINSNSFKAKQRQSLTLDEEFKLNNES